MNSCAIMQPTYLPWSGYFNLIKNVDIFIFLDDVQFDRRSWQTRNRINQGGRDLLLSLSTNKTTQNEFIKNSYTSTGKDIVNALLRAHNKKKAAVSLICYNHD